MADRREQRLQGKNRRHACVRVRLDDAETGLREVVTCLPTRDDEFGREIHPITGALADETNTFSSYQACQNGKATHPSCQVQDIYALSNNYPYWSDYVNWGYYNCGYDGCYGRNRPWYWGARPRRRRKRRRHHYFL